MVLVDGLIDGLVDILGLRGDGRGLRDVVVFGYYIMVLSWMDKGNACGGISFRWSGVFDVVYLITISRQC